MVEPPDRDPRVERPEDGRARRIQKLADISGRALEGPDIEELFGEVCRLTAETLGNECCALLRLDPESGELVVRSAIGWPEGVVGNRTIEVSPEYQMGRTIVEDEVIVVDDRREDERFPAGEAVLEGPAPSGISVPVTGTERPWGVFAVHTREPRDFSADDVAFVEALGHVLGRSVERRRTRQELEAYAERLEAANTELEQFVNVVSHDLKEPIRATNSYLQLFERRYRNQLDEDALELIAHAEEGARRSADMLRGLLKYARLDKDEAETRPVDAEDVLEDVLGSLSVKIDENDAQIEYEPLPTVRADPVQLGQVFQNLLSNSIKFAKPDRRPEIHVGAEEIGDEWRFTVEDHGIGMDQEDADELFQIFRQGPEAESGQGVGLAVCKKIVQRHGGSIWVETERGEGSTFHFTMPDADAGDGAP